MRNGPTKIILINSGKYEYAEVALDGAIQIVGPNNAGKTTLISTLQFLYIDDLSKMAFRGHTLDETFDTTDSWHGTARALLLAIALGQK